MGIEERTDLIRIVEADRLNQIRNLEAFIADNPNDAGAHCALATAYLFSLPTLSLTDKRLIEKIMKKGDEKENCTKLDKDPRETTLFKIFQSLCYELYTPFITDPEEFLDAGEAQIELFPKFALRKFQLYLRHADFTNEETYPEFLAYSYISDIYERLGCHKEALEARKKVYRESIHHLIGDIGNLLLGGENDERIFSLIKIAYDNPRDFWSDVISHHKTAISPKPSEFDFGYFGKLVLKKLLQKYAKQNPEEAESILKRIQTDFEEIHPESTILIVDDLHTYLEMTKHFECGTCLDLFEKRLYRRNTSIS